MDYTPPDTVITIISPKRLGDEPFCVHITINDDNVQEDMEVFTASISNPLEDISIEISTVNITIQECKFTHPVLLRFCK